MLGILNTPSHMFVSKIGLNTTWRPSPYSNRCVHSVNPLLGLLGHVPVPALVEIILHYAPKGAAVVITWAARSI